MRKFLAIAILLSSLVSAFAQQATPLSSKYVQQDRAKGLIYKKEWTLGAKIASSGWGITAEIGKIKNIRNTQIFEFGFDGILDPKQKKQSASQFAGFLIPGVGTPKDFFYGMQNQFFDIRAGFGYKHNIAEKAEKSGVALTLVYVGGITLGLLKPYYLDIAYIQPVDSTFQITILSQRYNPDPVKGNATKYLDWNSIYGASGFGKGLSEIQPIPGLYGKAALNFEWGAKDNFITAIEAGVTIDVYYKKVPIMINQNDHFIFWSVFLGIQLGKRS